MEADAARARVFQRRVSVRSGHRPRLERLGGDVGTDFASAGVQGTKGPLRRVRRAGSGAGRGQEYLRPCAGSNPPSLRASVYSLECEDVSDRQAHPSELLRGLKLAVRCVCIVLCGPESWILIPRVHMTLYYSHSEPLRGHR